MKTEDINKINELIPIAKDLLKYHSEAYTMSKMYAARDSNTSLEHIKNAIGQAQISLGSK